MLLAASLCFYYFGETLYVFLLLFSSLTDYLHGLGIEKYRGTWKARACLISSIFINVSLLAAFKYSDFFVKNLNALFFRESPLALLGLALPLGISFYTFQTISYTIDVYRGEVRAQKNLLDFTLYVTMFPQLVAGPIVRYREVAHQLEQRKLKKADKNRVYRQLGQGAQRFVLGMSKKVILANSLGELSQLLYAGKEPSVALYWTAAVAFAFQLYFDFSGYSDMAIGLGFMVGFTLPENFNYPFISQSVAEFWRRWHMTLSGWFRDYVYIPLGGSRAGLWRGVRNVALVWLLTGLWHGASWNFIPWGLYFAVILTGEKWIWGEALKRVPRAVRHVYTLLLLSVSFVIFDTTELSLLPSRFAGLLGLGNLPLSNPFTSYYLKSYGLLLLISVAAATPLPRRLYRRLKATSEKTRRKRIWRRLWAVLEVLFMAVFIIVCTAYIVASSFNPFLYFRF